MIKNSNKNQRLLIMAGAFLVTIIAVALILPQLSDKSEPAVVADSEDSKSVSEQSPDSTTPLAVIEEEITQGPSLPELPVYAAIKDLGGYIEQPRQPGDPPTAAAIRFQIADQPGFFWLSLFDENISHYIDPAEGTPSYNKKLYSAPLLGRSCHVLISDNETFILRHMTDNPPTTEAEIVVAQDRILFLMATLSLAGVENLGLVQPIPDSHVACWDSITQA